MPAKVFVRFFIVSSSSSPTSAARLASSPSVSWLLSGLSLGRSGCFLTAEVALLVAETELVSDAVNIRRKKYSEHWYSPKWIEHQSKLDGYNRGIYLIISQKYRIPHHALGLYLLHWRFFRVHAFQKLVFFCIKHFCINSTNFTPLLSLEALRRGSQLSSVLYKLLMLALIWQNPGLFCCWDVKALFFF